MDSDDPGTDVWANDTVPPAALPRLDAVSFEPLAPAFLRVRLLTAIGVAVLTAVVVSAVVSMSTSAVARVLVVVGALVVWAGCAMHRIEADRMGYAIREHDLSFRSGVISTAVSTVPFARVQHVSIGRGPLERRFGIASLQVRTAGGAIGVPGLPLDTAERLKYLVTERAAELADTELEPADPIGPPVPAAPSSGAALPPPTLPAPGDDRRTP